MAERTLTFFASDVHLGLDVKDKDRREARFVSFLNAIPKDRTESLFLLGDIWDFWYEYRDVVPRGYVRVFAALTALMDAGVKVYFFPGNHDIWCYSYFASLGITVLEQPYSCQIGTKTFCLGHGDGLGPGMHMYKLMRWTFHERFFQRLFSTLHPRIAFSLGNSWSKSSRLAKSLEYHFRGKDEPLYKWVVSEEAKAHADYYIFGHFHTSVNMEVPGGARLMILKDWMDSSPYFFFDGEALRSATYTSGGYVPNIE